MRSRIILLKRYRQCEPVRQYKLFDSLGLRLESSLGSPYIRLGLGGPGTWHNGEVTLKLSIRSIGASKIRERRELSTSLIF